MVIGVEIAHYFSLDMLGTPWRQRQTVRHPVFSSRNTQDAQQYTGQRTSRVPSVGTPVHDGVFKGADRPRIQNARDRLRDDMALVA